MSSEFSALQQRILEKQRLEGKLSALRNRRRELDRRIVSLKVDARQEQTDVERLQCRSLTNYILILFGKMEGEISEQQREAEEAKVRLDSALASMKLLDEEIAQVQQSLRELADCEVARDEAINRRRQAVLSEESPEKELLLQLEADIAACKVQQKELSEALSAGKTALASCDNVLEHLQSAQDWNTWDLWAGGGIYTHVAKYSHLDDAQTGVERIENALTRFRAELADVRMDRDIRIHVEGFLRFADYFFDGIFADLAVRGRIQDATERVRKTRSEVYSILSHLSQMEREVQNEAARLQGRLENLLTAP